jgi:hypothetical protein
MFSRFSLIVCAEFTLIALFPSLSTAQCQSGHMGGSGKGGMSNSNGMQQIPSSPFSMQRQTQSGSGQGQTQLQATQLQQLQQQQLLTQVYIQRQQALQLLQQQQQQQLQLQQLANQPIQVQRALPQGNQLQLANPQNAEPQQSVQNQQIPLAQVSDSGLVALMSNPDASVRAAALKEMTRRARSK